VRREFNKFTGVEQRQSKLAKNAEEIERILTRLFYWTHRLEDARKQRKRLLKGPSKKGYTEMPLTGIGGGAVDGYDYTWILGLLAIAGIVCLALCRKDGLNDSLEEL